MAASSVRSFSEDEFIELGLRLRSNGTTSGQRIKRETKINQFRSAYGVHPAAVSAIWKDLQRTPFVEDRIDPSAQPAHILIVYRWLKSYESELELHTNFGVPEKKIRFYCKDITDRIARLRRLKIDPNWEDDDGLIIGSTMDGIHYIINEPRPFSTEYSSFKEGGNAGLSYLYVLATHKPKLMALDGPYPAATQDRDVLRKKLKAAIARKQQERGNNFRVIADDGYTAPDLADLIAQ